MLLPSKEESPLKADVYANNLLWFEDLQLSNEGRGCWAEETASTVSPWQEYKKAWCLKEVEKHIVQLAWNGREETSCEVGLEENLWLPAVDAAPAYASSPLVPCSKGIGKPFQCLRQGNDIISGKNNKQFFSWSWWLGCCPFDFRKWPGQISA